MTCELGPYDRPPALATLCHAVLRAYKTSVAITNRGVLNARVLGLPRLIDTYKEGNLTT